MRWLSLLGTIVQLRDIGGRSLSVSDLLVERGEATSLEESMIKGLFYRKGEKISMEFSSPTFHVRRIVGQPPSAVGVLRFRTCRDKSAKRSSSCQVR